MKKEFTGFLYRPNYIRYKEFLDNRQLFFLRMYVHNCKMEDIYEFIEIDQKQAKTLKRTIINKFSSRNLVEATCHAFNVGALNTYDYAHGVVKKEASIYALQIINYFSHERYNSMIHNKIFELNLNFYRSCREAIQSQLSQNKELMFSEEDKHIVRLLYIGESLLGIAKSLSLSYPEMLEKFLRLKQMLRAENHFNFLRKAIVYNLIKHDSISNAEVRELCLKSMLNITKMYDEDNIKISQQNIMRELVEFYCDIEYRILFSNVALYTLELED